MNSSTSRSRPIPAGQVSVAQAAGFLVLQGLVGLAVLLQFNRFAIFTGIASLVIVAVYPFMKRITYWPQVTLGLAFSWGALMGFAVILGRIDATALVLFKEYPHVDVPERADDLFTVIEGAIEGRTKPVMAAFDCRMIGVFHTTREPMRGFVDKLQAMEGKDGVLSLSIGHGFPWADVKEMGTRLIAITDNDKAKAEKLARELGMEFFAMREQTQPPYVTLDAAMARVSSHNLPKPMVLADVSDNAGGGAASDSTFILKELLDRKVKDAALAMIWDPGAVKLAFEVGEGAELDIRLGGKLGPQSGLPVDARAKVLKVEKDVTIEFGGERKSVGSIGDAAALEIEGVTVIVNSRRTQCLSRDCFTKLGVDPSTKKVVVVKSMQHFHAAYAPIASEVVYVAAPGALVPDWSLLPYKKADKAQWPFVAQPHTA